MLFSPHRYVIAYKIIKNQLLFRQGISLHQIPIYPSVHCLNGVGAEDDFLGVVQEVHRWGAENVVVLGDRAVPFLVVTQTYEGEACGEVDETELVFIQGYKYYF